MKREDTAAWRALLPSARRVFAVIAAAIGDQERAAVSYADFRLRHHIGRQNISPGIKTLEALGFIEVGRGPQLTNWFSLSNRWESVDEADIPRLVAQARLPLEVRPERPMVSTPERRLSWEELLATVQL